MTGEGTPETTGYLEVILMGITYQRSVIMTRRVVIIAILVTMMIVCELSGNDDYDDGDTGGDGWW